MLEKRQRETPNTVTTGELTITLTDNIPSAHWPRCLAYAKRIQLHQIIKDLLEDGIIRENNSPYASPIVLVKKKSSNLRLCVDD